MVRTSSITMPSMAVDEKVFSFLSVTLRNYEVCDNEKVMMRKVCSCAPIFKFFYGPKDFHLGANLYNKVLFLTIFFWGGAVSPYL